MQKLQKSKLLFNTVRYLKPVQIYGRLWRKLHKPKAVTAIALSDRYDDAVAIDSVAYNFAADQLA